MGIAFLTLFFGLISGPYPVELSVNGPAAAVEVLVDGHSAARISGPPWKGTIDFGPALLPHEVVARALDAEGHELSRAQEWVNLPHPLSKAEIVLEGGGSSPPKAARVAWTHMKGLNPRSISLTFDGQPLKLDDSKRAPLPAHDLRSLHVLSADVEFAPLDTVHADLAYGGEFGSEVSTALTAIPLRVRKGSLPPPAELGRWLAGGDGQPLSVAAVEEGTQQLYVVRVPDARETALGLQRAAPGAEYRQELNLDRETEVRFIFPVPEQFATSGERSLLFDVSPAFDGRRGSLMRLLAVITKPRPLDAAALKQPKRIADAVAVAGLDAMKENRRRAVLLVLGEGEQDASRYDPATVRRFLAALRVPLFVWSFGPPAAGSAAAAWGAVDVSMNRNLRRSMEEIRAELHEQRIVLIDGHRLPQSIALSPAAQGVELVGGQP